MRLFKTILTSTLLCLCLNIYSQDLTGTWEGTYEKSAMFDLPQKAVLELHVENKMITGVSHIYYKKNIYEHYRIKGSYDSLRKTVTFTDDSVISVNFDSSQTNTLGTYELRVLQNGSKLTLEGFWEAFPEYNMSNAVVKMRYRKKAPGKRSPDAPKMSNNPLNRVPDIQGILEIDVKSKDSIKIEIVDNGIVDNDFVSLYLDDNLIIENQLITKKPIQVSISPDQLKSFSKLKLIAETLGSKPPCTALMRISIGNKRYEIGLSSNFNKNAIVEFFLKE